jgi:Tol biopolymer transport system component
LPDGVILNSAPALSPNGRHIAFVGSDAAGSRLYVRDLDSEKAHIVPASHGAQQPFWSPDSAFVGFFARGSLKKVKWPDGAPVTLAGVTDPRGGAWSSNGKVVFAPDLIDSELSQVGADGGNVEPAALLDRSRGDNAHLWPMFLPDGVHFLYHVRSVRDQRRGLYLGRIDRPAVQPQTPLLRTDSSVAVAAMDGTREIAVFSITDGRLEVRRLDPSNLTAGTDAQALRFDVGERVVDQPMMLSASADVLVYASSSIPYGNRLATFKRNGEPERLWGEAEQQNWPRVSPDGHRLARQRVDWLRGKGTSAWRTWGAAR